MVGPSGTEGSGLGRSPGAHINEAECTRGSGVWNVPRLGQNLVSPDIHYTLYSTTILQLVLCKKYCENTGFSWFEPISISCSLDQFFLIWPHWATGYSCGCIKIWPKTRPDWTLKH